MIAPRQSPSWNSVVSNPDIKFAINPRVGVFQDGAAKFVSDNKEYLTIAHADQSGLDLGTGDLAINIQVDRDVVGTNQTILHKRQDGSNYWQLVWVSNNKIQFKAVKAGTTIIQLDSSSTYTSTSQYYNISINVDRSDASASTLRVDDVDDTDTGTRVVLDDTTNLDNTGAFFVGCHGAMLQFLDGSVDSGFIWTGGRLLTAAEITWLHNGGDGRIADDIENGTGDGAGLDDAFLKAMWDFGEGDGETRFDSKGSNHLTPNAAELVTNGDFANWTGDNPDNWTLIGTESSPNREVTENPTGQAQIKWDTSPIGLKQDINIQPSTEYAYSIDIKAAAAENVRIDDNLTVWRDGLGATSGTGVQSGTATSHPSAQDLQIQRQGNNGDVTIDDLSIKVANPVTLTQGIRGGQALDYNKATSFDGASQYLSLASKNLLKSDDSIAYATVGQWDDAVGSGLSAIERVVLADEGLPTTGLPSGVKTAVKMTFDGGGETLGKIENVTITNNPHTFSFYVLAGNPYTSSPVSASVSHYTSNGDGDAVTPNTTTWQRATFTWTPGADVTGIIYARLAGSPDVNNAGDILYITGVQVEQSASVTNWDPNALFSPGDQDCWWSTWIRPDALEVAAVAAKWVNVGDKRAWSIWNAPDGKPEIILSSDGTSGTNTTHESTVVMVAENWYHLFFWYDATNDEISSYVNGVLTSATSHTSGMYQPASGADLEIGSNAGGSSHFDGRIDAVMMGCAAQGMTETFANIAAALFNDGYGIKYDDISAAQKTAWGLVETFDMDSHGATAFDGRHNSIALTNNGSLTEGDVNGAGYSAGVPGTVEDQSGEGNHLTQNQVASRPGWVEKPVDSSGNAIFNGNPAFLFDGITSIMTRAAAPFTGEKGGVFALIHPISLDATNQTIFAQADTGADVNYNGLAINGSGDQIMQRFQNSGGQDDKDGTTALVAGNTYIVGATSNGESGGTTLRISKVDDAISGGGDDGDWMADLAGADTFSLGALKRSSESEFAHIYCGPVLEVDGVDPVGKLQKDIEAILADYEAGKPVG